MPWSESKGYDTFTPVSDFIPKSKIPLNEIGDVELYCLVDGQERQREKCSQMIFSVPQLLSYISSICTLEEGDIVLTGTPHGVGKVKFSLIA